MKFARGPFLNKTNPYNLITESKRSFKKLNIDSLDDNHNLSDDDSSSESDEDDDGMLADSLHRGIKIMNDDRSGSQSRMPSDLDYNPKEFESMDVPSDLKEVMQYISKYSPQRIDIDYQLKVFMPEFVPAVGDIDAFLKVIIPKPLNEETSKIIPIISRLGLEVLDEPVGEQSEEALLQMKLRSIFSKPLAAPSAIVKSPKDIDKWITEIQSLHSNRIHDNIMQQQTRKNQINIDSLMSEWPDDVERKMDAIGFPNANLNCSLKDYIKVVCNIFDIPIENPDNHYDYIRALNILFNLFIAVRQEK